ncbi:MAG: DUF983 domain-containing protein [Planctomycetaceae bacterium]|nr:DUF983 domain-containing protein [Planctomycetaceae bacterium]
MGLLAIVRLRCPCCLKGNVFRSLWRMHDECPECGVSFEREPGFYYGAMYFSYGIGLALAAPVSILLFLKGFSEPIIFLVVIAQLAIVSPLLFRYSRVAWMHFDQRFDPR